KIRAKSRRSEALTRANCSRLALLRRFESRRQSAVATMKKSAVRSRLLAGVFRNGREALQLFRAGILRISWSARVRRRVVDLVRRRTHSPWQAGPHLEL